VDPYGGFPLCLSSLLSGSLLRTMLGAYTPHSTYPDANKGAQVQLFSQHESLKWRPSGMERNIPHIPYGSAWHHVSSGIVLMIASAPMTPAAL
jgi:hypothetical protein